MIRICYENFAARTHDVTGLHGRAERRPWGVTLYLLPGLTTEQRRAVIRRLRQEASRGFGPPLPLPQLMVALGLDRVRTAARTAGGVVRLHPAVTLLPGALMAAVMALFVIASAESTAGAQPAGLAKAAPAASAGSGGSLQAAGERPATEPVVKATAPVVEATAPVVEAPASAGDGTRPSPRPSPWPCPQPRERPSAWPRQTGGKHPPGTIKPRTAGPTVAWYVG